MDNQNNKERQEYKSSHSLLKRIFAIIGAIGLILLSAYLFKIIDILK